MILRFLLTNLENGADSVTISGDVEGFEAFRDALNSKLKLRDHLHMTLVTEEHNKVLIETPYREANNG
jgi:hypothetical protein